MNLPGAYEVKVTYIGYRIRSPLAPLMSHGENRKTVREYDLVRVASHVIAFRPFRPKGLGNDLSQEQLDTV